MFYSTWKWKWINVSQLTTDHPPHTPIQFQHFKCPVCLLWHLRGIKSITHEGYMLWGSNCILGESVLIKGLTFWGSLNIMAGLRVTNAFQVLSWGPEYQLVTGRPHFCLHRVYILAKCQKIRHKPKSVGKLSCVSLVNFKFSLIFINLSLLYTLLMKNGCLEENWCERRQGGNLLAVQSKIWRYMKQVLYIWKRWISGREIKFKDPEVGNCLPVWLE